MLQLFSLSMQACVSKLFENLKIKLQQGKGISEKVHYFPSWTRLLKKAAQLVMFVKPS